MPVISVGGIRDRVQTALSSYLGTRTYSTASGDADIPALVIDYGRYQDVSGTTWAGKVKKQTGLEVVIQPQTQFDLEIFHGNQFGLQYTTTVTLKQWDMTDSVVAAATALVRAIPDLLAPGPSIRVQRNSDIDTVESQAFSIVHQIK